jgi:hypothetical protein
MAVRTDPGAQYLRQTALVSLPQAQRWTCTPLSPRRTLTGEAEPTLSMLCG